MKENHANYTRHAYIYNKINAPIIIQKVIKNMQWTPTENNNL